MNGAKIGGQLSCSGATLNGAGGKALNAQRMVVSAGFFFRELKSVTGEIDLTAAHVGDLVDDMPSWPKGVDDLILDGFTYDRTDGPVTLDARRDWLAVGSSLNGDFFPQPYTQFARILRAMGHAGEARKVLAEQARLSGIQDRKRQRLKPDGKVRLLFENPTADLHLLWLYVSDVVVRWVAAYGHKPSRSLIWLVGLFLSASALAQAAWDEGSFAPNSDVILTSPEWAGIAAKGCVVAATPDCVENPASEWSAKNAPGMDWDSFNALAYAADLVVPLVDLGQTQAWAPSKDRGWMGWFMWWGRWMFIIAGWVVASLGLAAVTGFVQKNAPE